MDKKFIGKIERIVPSREKSASFKNMVLIKGGIFDMGGDVPTNNREMEETALPQLDEFPKHQVRISDFYMDEHEVKVEEFLAFVQATGYKTVAEYDIDWHELEKQLPLGTPRPDDEKMKAGSLVFRYPVSVTEKDNLGNVWEWTSDWYEENYYSKLKNKGLAVNPKGESERMIFQVPAY